MFRYLILPGLIGSVLAIGLALVLAWKAAH
jgi:hypothetical protein